MVSLLDIAPSSKQIHGVTVCGISAHGLAMLLPRFPELQQLMKGQGLSPEQIIKIAPTAVAAIIAAGCGLAGDEKAEAIASRMPVEQQFDFLEAIGSVTFTSGFGPFVKRLELLSEVAFANFGKVQDTNLHPRSSNLSAADSQPNLSGNSRRSK
jgi:hypothetical protein